MRLDHLLSKGKSEGRPPIGETRWRACEEAVAAAAGPKRRKPMAAGARQYEKRKRRDWLSKSNVLHPQGCLHPKSGSAAIGSRSQMFFTRRGACTPRGKVIWQKRARRWS
ncbi:hypothetical protein B9L21_13290 [Geobacillus uzenensis]|uniref:Uncharacterized protein n=1 Tax=Geobacillus uzenensis TaxID=129339 RepID=A0ABX4DF75_9BACL|nr:hypothetical protein B9L21_13290 [Geobacillus uzenensis]